MKKIKHSKFKNTGMLFELLVRQITIEILNGDRTDDAKRIVKEFFANGTELNKELRLYELLAKEKYNTESKAERFVDMVSDAHMKLNASKLNSEKYNLVNEISSKFDIEKFLSSPISNYKVLASIYKIFESKRMKTYDVKDVFNCKVTLIENIISKPINSKTSDEHIKEQELIESYRNQDKDLRLLTYKILVETFNKKYTNLNNSQKSLLREYINNINNTSKFNDYILLELPKIKKQLSSINSQITDKITNIKLSETIHLLESIKLGKSIKDSYVSTLMLSYELIKELNSKLK